MLEMSRFTGLVFLTQAVAVLSTLMPAFATPAGFDTAVAAYNSRQYSQALSQFQTVNRSNPSDASTHYYMGLCYQYLSQMSSAQQEYAWVYTYSTDQTLRYNAYQALQQIQQWSSHRAYQGQGNNFQRISKAGRPRVTYMKADDDQAAIGGG